MPAGRRVLILAASLVGALALAACQGSPVQLPGSGPLLTVTMRGGECPAGACEQSVIVERDGRVHAAAKPPNDLGQVPPETMAALTAAVNQTDFAAVKSHPFTGQCPTVVDGQELVFEFNVGTTTQRIASCEVDIRWGSPLFVAIGTALGEWIPIPLT
ncbi:MAG TPA: hypothetical protein VJ850_10060 [Candidatus Limnocylindrales bacterium]|nr:hypothetical protein [Candidatus Limnocylindrales bacterium]